MKNEYLRSELLKICQNATVHNTDWADRDSCDAQVQLGKLWVLLRDGCDYEVLHEGDLKTDEETIWLRVHYTDFSGFENDVPNNRSDRFYLPTVERLNRAKGKDWY